MPERILFVDDDERLLEALRRLFRKEYTVAVASSGEQALQFLESTTFAVVVSDLRMPGMDGIEVLRRVREEAPDTVRVMLTGHADLDAALQAINEGSIFRFHLKPFEPEVLRDAIRACAEQYRLVRVEKDLLEKTLHGSISVLSGVLSLSEPASFSRAGRLRRYVRHLARYFRMRSTWQVEVAAMLSQLGCVALSPAIIQKSIVSATTMTPEERHTYHEHALSGARLISQIPRLEVVAKMVRHQFDAPVPDTDRFDEDALSLEVIGGQMLRVTLHYDQSRTGGEPHDAIIDDMRDEPDRFFRPFVDGLGTYQDEARNLKTTRLHLDELSPGMMLAEDVKTKRDLLIATKGQEITTIMLQRMRSFDRFHGVRTPVLVYLGKVSDTAEGEDGGEAS